MDGYVASFTKLSQTSWGIRIIKKTQWIVVGDDSLA